MTLGERARAALDAAFGREIEAAYAVLCLRVGADRTLVPESEEYRDAMNRIVRAGAVYGRMCDMIKDAFP